MKEAPHQITSWLANVHRKRDAAVATVYGRTDYTEYVSDEDSLGRLQKLNLEQPKPHGSA